jgi:DNA recombination protein RmuC
MTDELAAIGALAGLVLLTVVLLLWIQARQAAATRDAVEAARQALDHAQRTEAEALRTALAAAERALAQRAESARLEDRALLGTLNATLLQGQGEQRVLIEAKLREMSEQSATRLAEIQRSVNERLAEAVEAQVQSSFQRVIDQFAAVQRSMADVQAVTAQIGDLKRVFTNVKARGGWGEAQLRALLRDLLPDGGWEADRRLRPDSDEVVEAVLVMPSAGPNRPLLAIDAKFPAEVYDRLLQAAEAGHAEEERAARRALETRLRTEARKIAAKYIVPGVTVDYAVMYLPTDSLYVEAARMPGLIEELGRLHRVMVAGPALLPALVRTIAVGAMSLTIAENAERIERILGGVRTEFRRIDAALEALERQSGRVSTAIARTRTRTRAMERHLRGVAALGTAETAAVLGEEAEAEEDDEEPQIRTPRS